jgi:photosystem II stability/assembly factor-like uncharacterized protein
MGVADEGPRGRDGWMKTLLVLCAAFLLSSSTVRGQGWTAIGPPGGDVRSLAVDPRDGTSVYAGGADGTLYHSRDGGRSWQRLSPGFPLRGMSLDDLVVGQGGELFVGYWGVSGDGGGVAASSDGGHTFTLLEGMAGKAVRGLARAPARPETLVASTMDGVFRSDDRGATWSRISPEGDPGLQNIGSVAIDPADPDTIYVGTWHLPYKTTDGGRRWQRINVGMITDSDVMTLTVDRRSRATVYATACSGIYRSPNAAERWAKIGGIPSSARRTRAFVQHPGRLSTFFAGTTQGLWRSEDDLATWRRVTPLNVVVNAIAVLSDGTLLLGCDGVGILRSSNDAGVWTVSNDGLFERAVGSVLVDRVRGRILAGLILDKAHGGVWTTAGGYRLWRRLGVGLSERDIYALAASSTTLYAGTDDGLYALDAEAQTWRRLALELAGRDLHPRIADLLLLSDRTILVASDQGLLVSADGGERWSRTTLGASQKAVALAAIGEGACIAASPLGFFRSDDGGASWRELGAVPQNAFVHRLAALPGAEPVYLAATSLGLLKSEDGGLTWRWRGGGLPHKDITALIVHPQRKTIHAAFQGGLYSSVDLGETWNRVSEDGLHSAAIVTAALDPASGALLAAASKGGLHLLSPPAGGGAIAAGR